MSRRTFKKAGRNLSFESLEGRRMMAGNVTAQVVGGHLMVTGDDASNDLEMVGTGVPGQFRLVGRSLEGSATLINGSAGPSVFDGVVGGLQINLRGGNDRLLVHEVSVAGDLNIDAGLGFDNIQVGDLMPARATRVGVNLNVFDAGGGYTSIFSANIGNNANVNAADASVTVNGTYSRVRIGGTLDISEWGGNIYSVDCAALNVRTQPLLPTDSGVRISDVHATGDIRINTYAGSDQVYVSSVFARSLTIDTADPTGTSSSRDHDYVWISNCSISNTSIFTGAGYDALDVDGLFGSVLRISTGSEWDHVNFGNSILDDVFADLGAGGDTMYFVHNKIRGRAELRGGDGDDFLSYRSVLSWGVAPCLDFERTS